jgi:tetratricopeptide (TPR) repeat protein
MVSVFLSHSSKDKPFVRDLADALEAGDDGIKVWLDEREIDYGANIVLKIGEGLDADVVLLILSPDSVDSNWVKEEWTDAYWEHVNTQTTKLAGVLYRDCTIPRLLRNKKYFDLRTNQPEGFRQIKTWLLGLRPPVAPLVHLPQRPALFIGRQPEIEDLRRRLKDPGSVAYISGLAGHGKTTLAKEYAHRYQRDFESVHWIPCPGRTITQMAGELAWQLDLKLEGELDSNLRELNGHLARKRRLVILDNVEDDAPAPLISRIGLTSVLVTTRLITIPFLEEHQPLQLPLFTEEQCFELFQREIGQEEVDRHANDARALFQRLGYLPIGIAVAARLIRKDVHYTIASVAKDLPENVLELLKKAIGAVSEKAQLLLAAMAVCAPEGFRLGLAAEIAELDEATSLDALQELRSRSLVEELDRSKRRYRLHALMREASATTESMRKRHAKLVQTEFTDWETAWRECEEDMADWQVAFNWSLAQLADDEAWPMACDLAFLGFSLSNRLGRLPEAHEISVRMASEANDRQDRYALGAWYGCQALILQYWGRLDDAMALHKKEEAICLELGDQNALQTSYLNQVSILQARGQLDKAMALLKKQEAISQELDNRDSLQASYGNQACILTDWGRLDEAMALLKKQEAICLELGDQNSLKTSYGNQAAILKAWGRLDEAMALHKKQEAICLELGNQHSLQVSYAGQALILKAWGRLDEAAALHKKEEAICLELRYRSSLARCYFHWGLLARKQGDSKTEREKLEQALALYTELKMPEKIKTIQDELNDTNDGCQPN